MYTYSELRNDPMSFSKFKSKELMPLRCNYCETMYAKSKHDVKTEVDKGADKNYCSRKCFGLSQRSLVECVCVNCGKSTYKKLAELKKGYKNTFCSQPCVAIFYNKKRDDNFYKERTKTLIATLDIKFAVNREEKLKKMAAKKCRVKYNSIEDRKIAKTLYNKTYRERLALTEIWGPYTRIYISKCAHSGKLFVSRMIRKYSPEYEYLYSRDAKSAYKFTFNVYQYPELFNISLLEQFGWYSVGGKSKQPINKNGCSRDHKVSINDAIKNGYDPFYIKHPMNCVIMRHEDNNKKNSNSTLDYEELVKIVDAYEAIKNNKNFVVDTSGF